MSSGKLWTAIVYDGHELHSKMCYSRQEAWDYILCALPDLNRKLVEFLDRAFIADVCACSPWKLYPSCVYDHNQRDITDSQRFVNAFLDETSGKVRHHVPYSEELEAFLSACIGASGLWGADKVLYVLEEM